MINHLINVTDDLNRDRHNNVIRIEESSARSQKSARDCMELLRAHSKEIDQLKKRTAELIMTKVSSNDGPDNDFDEDVSLTTTKPLLCLSCGNLRKMKKEIESLYRSPIAHTTRYNSPVLKIKERSAPSPTGSSSYPEGSAVVSPVVYPTYMTPMQGRRSEKAWTMFASKDHDSSGRTSARGNLENMELSVLKLPTTRK